MKNEILTIAQMRAIQDFLKKSPNGINLKISENEITNADTTLSIPVKNNAQLGTLLMEFIKDTGIGIPGYEDIVRKTDTSKTKYFVLTWKDL